MNNFIMTETIKDLTICDELINFFDKSEKKYPGVVYSKSNNKVKKDSDFKISTDVKIGKDEISTNSSIQKYIDELVKISQHYIEKYKFSNESDPWGIVENFNIQFYKPTEGFLGWHYERSTCLHPYSARHLTFMTYLNDVTDGGETEWYYQKVKIQPEKGLTVIWPADWTHTHRGVTSPTQNKYIVTGWFSYF